MRKMVVLGGLTILLILTAVQCKGTKTIKPSIETAKNEAPVKETGVKGLIKKLGDDDWQTREDATQTLIKMGRVIKPLIEQALQDNDPEIKLRARIIMKKFMLFKVTSQSYSEKDNLEQAVKDEFGANYRIADWQDVLEHQDNIKSFIEQTKIGVGESLMVTWDGKHLFEDGKRHFFITRFDHNKDANYLAHDNIDNHVISLGSWHGITMRVLCVRA